MNELNLRKITEDDLREILEKHEKWLNDEDGGERADLRGANLQVANLQWANLQGANLQGADMREADMQRADMRVADMRGANMRWANMRWANMRGADMQRADMRGADIDFSCWPLWCGSLDVIVDKRIAAQLAYHFCRLVCDDDEVKSAQKMLAPLANQFHRVKECGRIEE